MSRFAFILKLSGKIIEENKLFLSDLSLRCILLKTSTSSVSVETVKPDSPFETTVKFLLSVKLKNLLTVLLSGFRIFFMVFVSNLPLNLRWPFCLPVRSVYKKTASEMFLSFIPSFMEKLTGLFKVCPPVLLSAGFFYIHKNFRSCFKYNVPLKVNFFFLKR